MTIFFDIYFTTEKIKNSEELFNQYKAEILKGLNCKEEDVLFHIINKRLMKTIGHFFLKETYVKAIFSKSKFQFKRSDSKKYSDLNLNFITDATSDGLTYEAFFSEEEKFTITYEFEDVKDANKVILTRFINTVKQIASKSKNPDIKIPEADDILSGKVSIDNKLFDIELKQELHQKYLNQLMKKKEDFLKCADLQNFDNIEYLYRYNILLFNLFGLFMKDSYISFQTNGKITESKYRAETLYKDINDIEAGNAEVFKNLVPVTELYIVFKKDLLQIFQLKINIKTFLETLEPSNTKAIEHNNFITKFLTKIIDQTSINPDTYFQNIYDDIKNNWTEKINSLEFDKQIKSKIVSFFVFSCMKNAITQEKIELIFNEIDSSFLKALHIVKDLSIKKEFSKMYIASENIGTIFQIKILFKNLLEENFPFVKDFNELNLDFMKPLFKKFEKTKSAITSSDGWAASEGGGLEGILTSAVFNQIKKVGLAVFIKKWTNNELQNEIEKLEKIANNL